MGQKEVKDLDEITQPQDDDLYLIYQAGSSTSKKIKAVSLNAAVQTLTNKTLDNPVVNTPTGITKSDVGLNNVDNLSLTSILQAVYPVGSVYFNAGVATNPAILLGFGTWSVWGSGRVPVGVDAGQTEFDVLEETGGAKTHTITADEMPNHRHGVGSRTPGSNIAAAGSAIGGEFLGSNVYTTYYTAYVGGGQAHNNLQPYITVYMWKRTA